MLKYVENISDYYSKNLSIGFWQINTLLQIGLLIKRTSNKRYAYKKIKHIH